MSDAPSSSAGHGKHSIWPTSAARTQDEMVAMAAKISKRGNEELSTVLTDTILALCRNTLPHNEQFCLEGLVAVTVDKQDIFLVHLNHTIKKDIDWCSDVNKSEKNKNLAFSCQKKNKLKTNPVNLTKKRKRGRPPKFKPTKILCEDSNIKHSRDITDEQYTEISNHQKTDFPNLKDVVSQNSLVTESLVTESLVAESLVAESLVTESLDASSDETEMKGHHDMEKIRTDHAMVDSDKTDMEDADDVKVGYQLPLDMADADPSMAVAELEQLANQLTSDLTHKSTPDQHPNHPKSDSSSTKDKSKKNEKIKEPKVNQRRRPVKNIKQKRLKVADMKEGEDEEKSQISSYQCYYCGKAFARLADFKRHNMTHTGEKPFLCEFCSKTFRRKDTLQEHIRIHTGEKPYKCMYCTKAFTTYSVLHDHTKIHTGERPHKCNVCGKAFIASGGLNDHMRIHTGDKPFQCDVCGQRFTQSQHMNNHKKSHARRQDEDSHRQKMALFDEEQTEESLQVISQQMQEQMLQQNQQPRTQQEQQHSQHSTPSMSQTLSQEENLVHHSPTLPALTGVPPHLLHHQTPSHPHQSMLPQPIHSQPFFFPY